MNPFRTSAAAVLAALALAAVPATAVAHDGNHPFKNCTEAYDNGYSNIAKGDDHYGKHLDRDNDGVGCDQPPAGFEPREESAGDTGTEAEDTGTEEQTGTDLAETGGSDTTPYIAAGGAAVVLLGGGVMIAARRRRDNR
ncbi:excalibur calcium-binding domain-containing protein [Streptomyces sp. CHD11]|uniref:LAETG motif-containing sortase-dependent surface protein n=1 Tax=Streptomyces sp. CHD11 TaxID=2741325 RepID=UPI001BFCCF30|nr:LAETG motif-containing sortase-dependent surface protein [Streptomyces sp. CHD11]MBT3151234.1 excalibur calcium-binding domain-containing protein [Streptomyces sp. CHD11]